MSHNMTPTEFLTTLKVVRIRLPREVARREAEVEFHSANGHRPSHCIHGTSQWTDYDNICGPCEDGVTLRQMVCEEALRDVREFGRRLRVVSAALEEARKTYMPINSEALWDWASAPMADV